MKKGLLLISQRNVGQIDGTTIPCSLCINADNQILAKTPKKYGGMEIEVQTITPSVAEQFRHLLGNFTNYDVTAVEKKDYPDDMRSIINSLWQTAALLGLSVIQEDDDDEEQPA